MCIVHWIDHFSSIRKSFSGQIWVIVESQKLQGIVPNPKNRFQAFRKSLTGCESLVMSWTWAKDGPSSLLNDEVMSHWVGVKHLSAKIIFNGFFSYFSFFSIYSFHGYDGMFDPRLPPCFEQWSKLWLGYICIILYYIILYYIILYFIILYFII